MRIYMKRYNFILTLALIILSLLVYQCRNSYADDHKAAITVLGIDEAPNNYVDSAGKLTGISVDFIKAIMERTGTNQEIPVYPATRAIKAAESVPGTVTFSLARTPGREDKFHWISVVTRRKWSLFYLKSKNINLKKFEDARLHGMIGVQRGAIREKVLRESGFVNIDSTRTHAQNVLKLLNGRIDFAFADSGIFAIECSKMNIDINQFEKFESPYSVDTYIVMSNKGTPAHQVEKWIQAAQDIKKEGTFNQIARKWQKKYLNEFNLSSKLISNKHLEIH